MNSATRNREGVGCLKVILYIVGGFIVLGIACGFYVYKHAGGWFRQGGAATIKAAGTDLVTKMGMAGEDKKDALRVIDDLATRVQSGKISATQAIEIGKVFVAPQTMAALVSAYFPARYVDGSTLSADAKKTAGKTVQRFSRAIVEDKVPEKDMKDFMERVTEHGTGINSRQQKLKESLTTDELEGCLKMMVSAADAASEPAEVAPISVPAVVEAAIKKGDGETTSLGAAFVSESAGAMPSASPVAPTAPASAAPRGRLTASPSPSGAKPTR